MVHAIELNFLGLIAGARAACFYPSGGLAPNDVPCQAGTAPSMCCGHGYACLSNGICQVTNESLAPPLDTIYLRGTCTDGSWKSSNCPLFCLEEGVDVLDGGNGLTRCNSSDSYFCINRLSAQEASCEQGKKIFTLPSPSVITTIGVGPTPTSSSSSRARSSSSKTTTSTSRITAASSFSSSTTDTASSSFPTSLSQSGSTSGSQSQDLPKHTSGASSSSSSSSSNIEAIVGGTLGGIAVVILAALGGWVLARARKQQGEVNSAATAKASPGESTPPIPPQAYSRGYQGPAIFEASANPTQIYEVKPPLFELSQESAQYGLQAERGNGPSFGYR